MIEQLKQENKVVGAKQTRRALKDHRAKRVYMAQDVYKRQTLMAGMSTGEGR